MLLLLGSSKLTHDLIRKRHAYNILKFQEKEVGGKSASNQAVLQDLMLSDVTSALWVLLLIWVEPNLLS